MNSGNFRPWANLASTKDELSDRDCYPCPICRHGQITQMVMMESYACNFCRHIFSVNPFESILRLEDSTQPLQWRWRNQRWKLLRTQDPELNVMVWMVALTLLILPPSLVWLSSYTFPPLPDSPWHWFPIVWLAATGITHLVLVIWLLLEYYQVPGYLTLLLRWQHSPVARTR